MEQGTVSNHILNRSVTRHIRKNEDAVTGIGAAASAEDISMGFISEVAYLRAVNNLYGRGGSDIRELSLSFMLGSEVSEDVVRREMKRLTELAYGDNKNAVISGNTFVSDSLKENEYTVSIVITGDEAVKKKNVSPGDKLIFAGYPARYGTELLIRKYREKLRERFSDVFLDEYLLKCEKDGGSLYERYCIGRYIGDNCLLSGNDKEVFTGIKPLSFGGLYRAVWELADESGLGARIDHDAIIMEQETIEIAEFFRINPYMLLGTGAVILACGSEQTASVTGEFITATDEMTNVNGKFTTVIGEFTKEKGCTVVSSLYDVKREITSYKTDEIFKIKID